MWGSIHTGPFAGSVLVPIVLMNGRVSEDLAEPRSPGRTAAGNRPFHRAHRAEDRQAQAEVQSGCRERGVSALPEGGGLGGAEVLERQPGLGDAHAPTELPNRIPSLRALSARLS